MAITIAANLSKKVPLPGTDYSSHQASITITAEVTDLSHVHSEAERLYALAEQAVDHQLGLAAVRGGGPATGRSASNDPAPMTPSTTTQRPATASRASQPYPRTGGRRGPAPATDSQLRFLERLVSQTGTNVDAICSAHRVGSLADLSCKEAAGVIDELKARGVAA